RRALRIRAAGVRGLLARPLPVVLLAQVEGVGGGQIPCLRADVGRVGRLLGDGDRRAVLEAVVGLVRGGAGIVDLVGQVADRRDVVYGVVGGRQDTAAEPGGEHHGGRGGEADRTGS